VRDTPFERRQHESTAKHQNNLKRFLRDIQNDHERNEREKKKAKDEVERLNRITGTSTVAQPTLAASAHTVSRSNTGAITAADQKRQWSQLAEMGIQVPDSYGGEMATPSGWKAISQTKLEEALVEESLSKGIRKRKLDDEEAEEMQPSSVQSSRKVWGKTIKTYPGEDAADLDALLAGPLPHKKKKQDIKKKSPTPPRADTTLNFSVAETVASPSNVDEADAPHDSGTTEVASVGADKAIDESDPTLTSEPADNTGETSIVQPALIPVFKKRKGKATSNSV
jgi:hypothetical protein